MTHQKQEGQSGMPKISLSKIPSSVTPWEAETLELSAYPSEWELDRRRTMINPTVATLTGHREGLRANDEFSLASAFRILIGTHPRTHAWNRQTMGVEALR